MFVKEWTFDTGSVSYLQRQEECQAALLRWRSIRLGPKELLVADFYLLIYCSTPRSGEVEKNRRTGEHYKLTCFPAICFEPEHHTASVVL